VGPQLTNPAIIYHIAFPEHWIVCSHNTDVVRTVSTSTAGENPSCLVTAGSSEDDAANVSLSDKVDILIHTSRLLQKYNAMDQIKNNTFS
jgi:hypothetical protein